MSHSSSHRSRWITFVLLQVAAIGVALCAHAWRAVIDALSIEGVSGCIMHDLLHVYCPLCGGTRAFLALCRGQIWLSLQYHPLALYITAGFLTFDGIALWRLVRHDERSLFAVPRWYWAVAIGIAAAVFITRNVALIWFGWDNVGDLIGFWHPM